MKSPVETQETNFYISPEAMQHNNQILPIILKIIIPWKEQKMWLNFN